MGTDSGTALFLAGTGIVGKFLYNFRVFEYPECFFIHNNLIKIIAAVPHDFLTEPSKQIQNQLPQWVRSSYSVISKQRSGLRISAFIVSQNPGFENRFLRSINFFETL